jgi:hypothetical protein
MSKNVKYFRVTNGHVFRTITLDLEHIKFAHLASFSIKSKYTTAEKMAV